MHIADQCNLYNSQVVPLGAKFVEGGKASRF